MTAISLYDAFAHAQGAAGGAAPSTGDLAALAEKLVADTLADLQRLGEYEQQTLARGWRDPDLHQKLTRLIYDLHRQWSAEAEQVQERVRRLAADGTIIAGADDLDQALWRIQPRLKLSPEQIERATEQVRRGETVPAEVLRNELRARLRA